MSRAWRIEYEGALYYLLSRGNEGSDIFIDNEAYLLQLSYYIHRNPLRAGIVKRPAGYRWSSYKVYAYDRKTPKWLSTNLILSQFEGEQDRHKSYRGKVQKYAKEEKGLFEDLRYGLIVGTGQFAEKIRKKYLPSKLEVAMPQQSQLATTVDLQSFLVKAERKLKCNVKDFIQAARLSGAAKEKRDLLLYFIWQAGYLRNEQIGNLFGISYSAVSHIVRSFKAKLKIDQKLRAKLGQINSLYRL